MVGGLAGLPLVGCLIRSVSFVGNGSHWPDDRLRWFWLFPFSEGSSELIEFPPQILNIFLILLILPLLQPQIPSQLLLPILVLLDLTPNLILQLLHNLLVLLILLRNNLILLHLLLQVLLQLPILPLYLLLVGDMLRHFLEHLADTLVLIEEYLFFYFYLVDFGVFHGLLDL